jgi:hypothetical protein
MSSGPSVQRGDYKPALVLEENPDEKADGHQRKDDGQRN